MLDKYLNIICPYINTDKLMLPDNQSKSLKYKKLIDDEIEYINDQEGDEVLQFLIAVSDDKYIKCLDEIL